MFTLNAKNLSIKSFLEIHKEQLLKLDQIRILARNKSLATGFFINRFFLDLILDSVRWHFFLIGEDSPLWIRL